MAKLISDIIDELLAVAEAQGCKFPPDFKKNTIDEFARTTTENMMWQDYVARRPMEVETYLGSPIRLAQEVGVPVPRIETLYALLHNTNIANRNRPKTDGLAPPLQPGSPSATPPLPRGTPATPRTNGVANGNGMPRMRPRGSSQLGPAPPGMRRPTLNGGPPPNGYPRPPTSGSRQPSRRGSMEGAELEEFSHLVHYDDIPEGGEGSYSPHDLALRERELQLRQRELALREQEMRLRRAAAAGGPPPGSRKGPPSRYNGGFDDDDDDDDDYYDPASAPPVPLIDPDNFDMMSVTSKKTRKAPSDHHQLRKNPEPNAPASRSSRFKPKFGRNRSSHIVAEIPGLHDNILDDPLMSFTSNRYGNVDRGAIHAESRTNSLTAARLDELQYTQGPPPHGGMPRRASQSPGNPYTPSMRGGSARPSPPNGYSAPYMNGGRPSPPDGMRQPMPRYPPGHGNAVVPQQVEQHAGVSALQPPDTMMTKNVRSLTGSASASAASGDSTHQLESSEPSAHSSQSSLGPRPPIGVR